jgi:TatD DNase family protein
MPFFAEVPNISECNLKRQWIDSHCHFDFKNFDCKRDQHWQQLQNFGCVGLVIPGVRASSWPKLIDLCQSKPWGFALGLHPYFLSSHKEQDIELLEQLTRQCLSAAVQDDNKLVAIGEFGLDFMLHVDYHKNQVECCRQQFQLAQSHKLPAILHCRKAYDEIAAMVRRLNFNQGGVVHAFSGSYQQGIALIDLGFTLGIGGALSHPRATKLRKTISRLPLSSLVLETDSPDMKPAFWQGPDNSPITLLFLAQIVASLHDITLDEVVFSSNNNLLKALPNLQTALK